MILVGCGESQQSAPAPESKPVEPVAEASQPEPSTAEAPDYDIWVSARLGNIEAVRWHLDAGTDVNAKGVTGWTALHHAALNGGKEIVELLIGKGADVNAKNNLHKTPLYYAERETIDLLRKHGGKRGYELKAEATQPEPTTAKAPDISIHKAAEDGNIEAVKQYLDGGADVNAKDKLGWTPLNHAAEGGHKEIIELLIANGADVNAQNKGGYTPLHTAILNDETEIAELLITKGADVNAQNGGGPAPFASCGWVWPQGNRRTTHRRRCGCECERNW